MSRKLVLLSLLFVTFISWSQRTPLHPLDIKEGSTDLYTILDTWEPGTPPPGTDKYDDQFYISRVRPLERIVDGDYQVNPALDRNRNLAMWVPLDDPTSKWKSLPRYSFEGDNFSMWSYTDIHGNWTAPWLRVSAGISDVAHKNGVKVGAVKSIPWNVYVVATSTSEHGKVFYRMFLKNTDGSYKYSDKLVKLMKYYGIDGLGCNSEFRSNATFMNELIAFVKDCKQKAKAIDWEFQLHWYDGTNDNGGISFDQGLATHNDGIFGNGVAPVTDMMFFNYNWNNTILSKSVTYAEGLGRSSYDLYAGFDIQGRAYKNTNWQALKDNKISIGFWGAHAQSLIHQSATDDGSSDIAIQKAYLLKQELTFSGGNRNPGLNPPIKTDASLANADLNTFHGLSALLTAKSTLQHVPFVTRFSLGNGLFFNNEGKTTFNHKWHNINTQDFLPTWRWWITDRNDQVTQNGLANLIKADFTFDDAWFGGSCLKLHGQTDFSRIKLFKTKLAVQPDYTLSLTYKVLKGINPKAKLFIAKQGAITTYLEVALPSADAEGEWKTHTFNLAEFGLVANDVVSMIGITFETTDSGHEVLLGELALRNPVQTFKTITPTITKFDVLRRRYNELDFKVFYQSKEELNGGKTYNDEVDTWYFEIYLQQKDQPEQLLTATTSWAGYVIDAPLLAGGASEARVGVRAVSPDGKQSSPISWSEYQAIPYDTPVDEVVIDKPVVKPNEVFVVKYKDELHVPAQKWEIKDPITGNVLESVSNATQLTTQIKDLGLYDLYITDDKGKLVITRGFVQITPEETGAVPQISSFSSDKIEAKVDENVRYSYTSKDGEGSVSRSLRIEDPNMFMIPADAQQGMSYSYALWFKVNSYSHDKQGTNLINKNSIADQWPHNNWGDLWVTIRPEWQGNTLHPANEVSFNTFGWDGHDIPNESMMSTGFSVTPGVWNHLLVSQNASKLQKMYFNGKKVAETTNSASSRRENSSDSRIDKTQPANIFFGGGGVYKAGFDGWIDEVQVWNKELTEAEVLEAMKGYTTPPQDLIAYYTFEVAKDGTYFENKGAGSIEFKGEVVKMDGSGGEATSSAAYVPVPFSNDELGYPGIPGSLSIITSPEWIMPTATVVDKTTERQIDVVYKTPGKFDAGIILKNMWGSVKEIKEDYILINSNTGIGEQDEINLSLYPNPFVDELTVRFKNAGSYDVKINSLAGKLVSQRSLSIASNQFVNIAINGAAGTYLVSIYEKGKLLKSVKVIKR